MSGTEQAMTEQAMTEQDSSDRAFCTAIANQMGVVAANVEAVLDHNPSAPVELRAALVRILGKCLPLTAVEQLERMRAAYQPPPRASEADRPAAA